MKFMYTIVYDLTVMTKVDVISIENVKPFYPTPPHLHTFNLSLLNQLIPAPYAPVILYYPNQDGTTKLQDHEVQEHLKRSLSETLTRFYPLAGTIKDDLSIDCDDSGASYAVACVDTSLTDFLKHLDLESINCLLPCDPTFNSSSSGVRVTNVQVNFFECGGFAISLCISHKILDGAALATFLKCWAALLRQTIRLPTLNSTRSEEVVYPDLTIPFLPANNTRLRDSSMLMWASLIKIGKCSTKRFVFDHPSIATLKAEAANNGVQQPTRVEVVSAFLWKCVMEASHEKCGFKKPSLLTHVINLRKRSGTTLSENSIGNLVWIASTECTTTDIMFHELVDQVRGSILGIGSEFVAKLQGDKGEETMEESLKQMKDCGRDENADYLGFTSWCKMGFYEVDFGWGKPIWVCGSVSHGSPVFTDFVVLMDTRYGDGIEAWVNLDEHKMCILQHNPELLAFASLDPSPLQICEDAIN